MAGDTGELRSLAAEVAALTASVNRLATGVHAANSKIDSWDDFWRGTNGVPGFRQDLDGRCRTHTDEIERLREDVAALQLANESRGNRAFQWVMAGAQWVGAILIAWYTAAHASK